MGKVPLKKGLVHRHILDGHDAFARNHLKHAIDQQHRIAMRQAVHDLSNVEFHLDILHTVSCDTKVGVYDSFFSSARKRRRKVASWETTAALRCHWTCSA